LERDIDAAFLGSLNGTCYTGRRKMLDEIVAKTNMLVTRTASGEDYLNTLNRIKIFVSADISMGEYMIKNFEAMACGCVLMLMSQGAEEDRVVGFSDMENVVFYTSAEDAVKKIDYLKNNPKIASEIAAKGQLLAESRFSLGEVGRKTATEISKNMREIGPINPMVRYWAFVRYGLALK
jgi:glycosyltransferase involved in cell wall biosynthesis